MITDEQREAAVDTTLEWIVKRSIGLSPKKSKVHFWSILFRMLSNWDLTWVTAKKFEIEIAKEADIVEEMIRDRLLRRRK